MSRAREVKARAGCRVDFAGGTLDIWPLGVLHPGAVTVNVAIDVEVEIGIRERQKGYRIRSEDEGGERLDFESLEQVVAHDRTSLVGLIASELGLPATEIHIASGSPRGAGLGGSSALAIALIAASERYLGREDSSLAERSALARDIEARLMQLPTGRQDHYTALLGGALEIRHQLGGERVRRLEVDLEELGESLVVAYTGVSHFSARNNWGVIRSRLDGDPGSVELFDGIAEIAASVPPALESGDLERVGRLMSSEWTLRRRLASAVSTALIEELLEIGTGSGAWGGKACGAGGGGCVALLCPSSKIEAVRQALGRAGAELLPARPSPNPVSVG